MRLARVGVVAVAVGVLAALLSGCVVFDGAPKLKQKGNKPKAIVTFNLCLTAFGPESTCPDAGNSEAPPVQGDFRLLVGLRFSKGAKAPATIEARSIDLATRGNGPSPVLGKNPSYTAELKEKAPGNPSKFKWVGYSSEPGNIPDDVDSGTSAKFRIKLELKDKLIGERLKVRPVVGSYQVSGAQPENDPIDCGPDPFEATPADPNYFDGTWRICIDSPLRDEFRNLKVKIDG